VAVAVLVRVAALAQLRRGFYIISVPSEVVRIRLELRGKVLREDGRWAVTFYRKLGLRRRLVEDEVVAFSRRNDNATLHINTLVALDQRLAQPFYTLKSVL
jgi:hypothetical protein